MIDKFDELIDLLKQQTARGQLNWQTTADVNEFIVHFKGFSVSILKSYEDADAIDGYLRHDGYSIVLRDSLAEYVDSKWISTSSDEHDGVTTLFEQARRKAKKIDVALDQIIAELKESSKSSDSEDDIPF
jgi:hypothetical protein